MLLCGRSGGKESESDIRSVDASDAYRKEGARDIPDNSDDDDGYDDSDNDYLPYLPCHNHPNSKYKMPNQAQSQSQANSLLNLLNPYQQSTRDVRHLPHPHPHSSEEGEPESPSAMLLRELQGQSDEEEESERERYIRDEREGMSPTPTPSRSVLGLGLNTISNQKSGKETTTTNSSEDDEQPPQSLMYANPTSTRHTSHIRAEESPGPFRPAGSSSTTSRRSASTSPGPSTISNYASGLDLESTVEPTVSPVASTKNIHIPTFREPPRPSRTISGSSRRPSSSGEGYLDPPLSASRKGKGKEKKLGGRKYHQVQDSDDTGGDQQRQKVGKEGLNDYEKALWKWVNVDDLDGFLQEVS